MFMKQYVVDNRLQTQREIGQYSSIIRIYFVALLVDVQISKSIVTPSDTPTDVTTCNNVTDTTDSHTRSVDHTYCKITGVDATDANKMTAAADSMDIVTADTTDNNEAGKITDTPGIE